MIGAWVPVKKSRKAKYKILIFVDSVIMSAKNFIEFHLTNHFCSQNKLKDPN